MKNTCWIGVFALFPFAAATATAQSDSKPVMVKAADERFKTDILVVVAHPDDEGGVTPYLARAIYDEHKKVSVVFATRGGSGGNDYSREHGPALADIREQEARQACARLGIANVWFLNGKDTASQNVLNSLANWGHGANLEELVRIVRLTRPEVIISWLPGIFIGEDHGDHQASGVLATEAFDLAGDPTAFPAQVAGATKRLEVYLENLAPWQPKKLYYFSDADSQKQFDGTGPAYSVKEISPSEKKAYWRLALGSATSHLTQFPVEIHQLASMSDEQLNKFMADPQHMWWSEPMTLIFGKSTEAAGATKPIFPESEAPTGQADKPVVHMGGHFLTLRSGQLRLGGPWAYYEDFRRVHQLQNLPLPSEGPEIAVKAGSVVTIPLFIRHDPAGSREIHLAVTAPAGWTILAGAGQLHLPAEETTAVRVEVQTPDSAADATLEQLVVTAEQDGKSAGSVRLLVLLKGSGLPQ